MERDQSKEFPSVKKSLDLFQKANELIPGGTQLLSRSPVRYAYGVSPIFAERASGARVWDVDGNEYIDMTMAINSAVLGYCDPDVDQAVREQMQKSTIFSILNKAALELAKELVEIIPSAEMVRFGKTGGETDAMAIRIARGFTGRDKVVFCGYHGWHDWYIAGNLESPDSLSSHLGPNVPTTGVPKCLSGTTIPFEYNNLSSLEQVLERNRGEVACVIMEPSRSFLPQNGFLEGVKDLAHHHGALLIFDEVNTGFRLALGGAQEFFGVTPDMTVFGKAIANGYPLTSLVGRRDVMQASTAMFISSTFWDDNATLAAGLACIKKIKTHGVIEHIWKMGERYVFNWRRLAHEIGVKAEIAGLPCMSTVAFKYEDKSFVNQLNTLYCQELARRGIFSGAPGYFVVSFAHKEQEVDEIIAACEQALKVVKRAVDQGSVEGYLKAEPAKPLFDKRMV